MTDPLELASIPEQYESQQILGIVLLTTTATAFADRLYFELLPSLILGVGIGYAPIAVSPLLVERLEFIPDTHQERVMWGWWILFASAYPIYLLSSWSYKLSTTVGAVVVVAAAGGFYSLGQIRENEMRENDRGQTEIKDPIWPILVIIAVILTISFTNSIL